MAAKKLALLIDVDDLNQRLRGLHNRALDPALLLETAAVHGEIVAGAAVADWGDVEPELKTAFEGLDGIEVVQVDRIVRPKENGRRKDVTCDLIDLEILARMVEVLFKDGGPEVDGFVVASSSAGAARAVALVRDKFQKEVRVVGVEGGVDEALQGAASAWETLAMPAIEPQDREGLAKLVPLLEDLERRKRYLNFKYIRETVVRRLDLPERSFEAAERLLSDAIACGLLLKQKIDDKYNPGQLFTAYAINRESAHFHEWGSGEPAPAFEEEDEPPARKGRDREKEEAAGDGPVVPTFGRAKADDGGGGREDRGRRDKDRDRDDRGGRDKSRDQDQDRDRGRDDDRDEEGGGRRRRRRRRRRSGSGGAPAPAGQDAPPSFAEPDELPPPVPLSAGKSGKGGKGGKGGKKKRQRNPQLDRVGRSYEAPSRFLTDEEERPQVADDDIDLDRILRARGDQ